MYRIVQGALGAVLGVEILAQVDPTFSVPTSGMVQWLIVALLGVVMYMLKDLHGRAAKWQESTDQRIRQLEATMVRHDERLSMFPFFARMDEAIDHHRHRRDAEPSPHSHQRKEEKL